MFRFDGDLVTIEPLLKLAPTLSNRLSTRTQALGLSTVKILLVNRCACGGHGHYIIIIIIIVIIIIILHSETVQVQLPDEKTDYSTDLK